VIRHVVHFTWSAEAGGDRRRTVVAALRRLREDVGGMDSLVLAEHVRPWLAARSAVQYRV
jgi:hypothetical protein